MNHETPGVLEANIFISPEENQSNISHDPRTDQHTDETSALPAISKRVSVRLVGGFARLPFLDR